MQLRHALQGLAVAALAAALPACQQADAPETEAEAAADAAPEAKPGLALEGGRLVLNAVAGRPAAAYFTLENSGNEAVEVVSAFVEGAERAEMHETIEGTMKPMDSVTIEPGASVAFEPGGKHVMAFGMEGPMGAGDQAEITLTFSDGDKISAPLAIEKAGAGMGGMDHGDSH